MSAQHCLQIEAQRWVFCIWSQLLWRSPIFHPPAMMKNVHIKRMSPDWLNGFRGAHKNKMLVVDRTEPKPNKHQLSKS